MRTCTTARPSAKSAQRSKHNHRLKLSRFHVKFTVRQNVHTGDETFKTGVVVDSLLGLKYGIDFLRICLS